MNNPLSAFSRARERGFTIVELLIVIVVIGILVAIVIVAYNGIQQRAHAATVQADLEGSAKKMANDNTLNGSYALTAGAVDSGKGLPTSAGTTYVYHSTGTTYCITGTNGTSSYTISDTAPTPTAGGCPGDGIGGVAAVTNLITNPSFEGNTLAGTISYDAAPITLDSTTAAYGSISALVTTNTTAYPQGMYWTIANATASTTYTCSISLKGTTGQTVNIAGRADNSSGYLGEGYGSANLTLSSTWQRATITFTTPATTTTAYIQYRFINSVSGLQAWADGVFCAQGGASYGYADGNSSSWIWNGTQNNSTSTGPAH